MTERVRTCGCPAPTLEHLRRNEAAGFSMHLCFDHAKAHDEGRTFVVTQEETNR